MNEPTDTEILEFLLNQFQAHNLKMNGESDWVFMNGGSRMKAWVNNTLTQMRNNVKNNERPTEVDNAKVQSSDYKTNVNTLNRSSVAHKATSQKHDTSMAEQSVVESLRRIKEIISKI